MRSVGPFLAYKLALWLVRPGKGAAEGALPLNPKSAGKKGTPRNLFSLSLSPSLFSLSLFFSLLTSHLAPSRFQFSVFFSIVRQPTMERAPPHAVLLLGVSLGAALSLSLPRALRALASVQDTLLGRNDGAVGSENELGTLPAAFFLGGLLGCTLTFSIWRSIGDREATVVAAAAQAADSASAAAAAAAARSAEKGSQSYSPSRTDGSPGRNGHGHSNGNGIGNGNGSGKVEVTDALHTRVAHLQMRGRAKGKVPRKLGKSFGTICSLGGSPQRIKGRKGGRGEVLGGPGKRSGKGGPDVFVGDAHSDLRNGGETGDAAFAAACAAAASTPASSAATTTMTTSTAVAATAFGTAAADAAAGRAAKPEDRLEPFTATEAADASSQSSSAVQQYKSAAAAAAGVYRIVLTGGPCGGKSSSVRHLIEALTTLGFDVLSPPEVPTLLLNGGCEYPGGGSGGSGGGEGLEATAAAATMLSTATAKAATTSSSSSSSSSNNNKMSSSSTVSSSSLSASAEAPTPTTASTPDDPLVRFEVALFRLQRQMEDSFYACARNTGRPTVIIFDRGLMDISAYCSAEQWATILRTEGCEADAMDRPSIYSPPLRSLSRWKGHRDRHWQRERQRQQLQRERERERKRRRERRRQRRRRRKKKGNGGISSTSSSSSAAAAEAASASSSTSASAAAAVAVAIDGEDVVGAAATAAQEETASASQPEPKTPRAPASEMEGHALSAARASAIASRLGGLGFMDTLLHSPGTAPGNASLRPLALLEVR